MTWDKLLKSPYLTLSMSILSIFCTLLIFSLPIITSHIVDFGNKDSIGDFKNITQSSLLPEGYSPSPSSSVKPQPEETKNTILSQNKNTSQSKKKEEVALPEKKSSTVEGRDADRRLVIGIIADLISEYNFYYQKYPLLYSDKSETSLFEESSEKIYLYNNKENQTNALGFSLPSDTYLMKQVNTCEGNFSQNKFINFVFDSSTQEVILCMESQKPKAFIVF